MAWRIEYGQRLRFALEAGEVIGVIGKPGGKHLDRNVAVQFGVAGTIHLTHPASPKRAVPRQKWHQRFTPRLQWVFNTYFIVPALSTSSGIFSRNLCPSAATL